MVAELNRWRETSGGGRGFQTKLSSRKDCCPHQGDNQLPLAEILPNQSSYYLGVDCRLRARYLDDDAQPPIQDAETLRLLWRFAEGTSLRQTSILAAMYKSEIGIDGLN